MDHFPPSSSLEIMLLGGFHVRRGGRPVAGISYGKMRALLAYLAVERQQDHRRESLAALLWPHNTPETARANLRRTMTDLRRALESPSGEPLFSADKHSVSLACRRHVDTAALAAALPSCTPENAATCNSCLTQMGQMAELYRGEFMAGFSLPDCPEFEDWIAVQREAMHRHALALLEKASDCHEKVGDYRRAIQFALRHTELEPWNESAHCRVMRLYMQDNQRGAALAQYEACCRHLSAGLGVPPGDDIKRLAECIRGGTLPHQQQRRRIRPLPGTFDLGSRTGLRGGEPGLEAVAGSGADRRQVTVLSCELSLSAPDDTPDEALELLRAHRERCMNIILLHSGHAIPTHDGGLLAYFGYPRADEHAARHAVQAALAVTRETSPGIEARAGVHTGLIIAGSMLSMPDTTGQTTKTAIQLRGEVGFREVAISGETCRIASGHFDCVSLGVRALPGLSRAIEAFRVTRENDARTRLDAAAQLTPFTGRKAEIAQLLAAWKETSKGKRNIVLVQGEPGIGKSRLLLALKKRLPNRPHTIRELRCFPEFSQSPFHPLIAMLEGVFGFAQDDTPERKSSRLARHLETHFPAAAPDAIPLLSELLSLPLDARHPAPSLTPQKQKSRTIEILLDILGTLASRHPVLLVIEDLHWIDPSTLELLSDFITQKTEIPVFALLTARPEFDPPWDESLETTLFLKPLSEEETAEMIAAIGKGIPEPILNSIADRTDGVPLFIEEMAKIATLSDRTDIPITLHDLLAARIDAMGQAKSVAQIAATIGREFSLDLLRRIYAHDPASLAYGLNMLQDADIIRAVNETTRQFKHALIQEAAYQSQTWLDRQDAHRLIAEAIQNDFPEVAANQPEIVAQHLSAAGETWRAIEFRIKAGQRATRHSANAEAIRHFNDGLELLRTLPHNRTRDHMESRLHLSLGTVLVATTGYGSVEAGQTYTRALALCGQLGDNDGLYQALWGMWLTSSSRVDHSHSLALGKELLCLAEQSQDPLQLQLAHHALGNSLLITGNLPAARSHLEASMALYKPEHHEILVSRYGENSCVSSGSLLSAAWWLQGFPSQAEETSRNTVAMARQLNHPNSLGYALCAAAMLQRWMKQVESSAQFAQEAMTLSHRHGLSFWLGFSASAYGWAMVMQGQPAGIAQMRECVAAVNAVMSGSKIIFLAPLNDALVHLGQFENALAELNETLQVVVEKNDRFLESEFHRLKGECLLHISPANTEAAEACFEQALAISRQQGAKSLELCAAMSMARVWRKQGKTEEARQLLEGICHCFAEGKDTPDLQEAARLMQSPG